MSKMKIFSNLFCRRINTLNAYSIKVTDNADPVEFEAGKKFHTGLMILIIVLRRKGWHIFFTINRLKLPKITVMIKDNDDLESFIEKDNINSSFESTGEIRQKSEPTVTIQGTKFTQEEVEEANKPQRNVILETIGGSGIGTPDEETDFRDTERVDTRANEAPDSTDTNTGGIAAGGAKGANQS